MLTIHNHHIEAVVHMTNVLLEAGADPNVTSQSFLHPLGSAARGGFPGAIRKLLKYGADPNTPTVKIDPPLYGTIELGTLDCVHALLDG
jgi:hypothetical protein